ncbi:Multi-copper polyphenol oxidoreductase, laccase [Pseudovibrio sp. FO-BEG1]|uniref:peptidoglycan editing factor PgeF n=1 Tax=Pseudovibrio sp. (strain FO-BEG1) TaxID=911045 RepID=UPI000238C2F9|nr:peptidoglycan editing factor PgeF [Pseudovibrio sp. FO-BEG1]AEV38936.1 Multi-copper polyphenol oxidoreductase, laccase [Pseudovibrio sp. FO-BEG1]
MIKVPELEAMQHISHGFFTREGGVSSGIYKGLNVGLGSSDNREDVLENRRRVAEKLGTTPEHLVTPYQIHSTKVLSVTGPFAEEDDKRADALVTNTPGVAIGILTADCGPILFVDPDNGVIGAAHSGWKGAVDGILPNTVKAMQQLGADPANITAVMGPMISQKAYEVGPEFALRFLEQSQDNQRFFVPSEKPLHSMFDLPAFIKAQLDQLGLKEIIDLKLCTYADADRFFSYRRTTHNKEPDYGRQISTIMLTA